MVLESKTLMDPRSQNLGYVSRTETAPFYKSKRVTSMLRSKLYQEKTGAVVIDEVHMVTEWGEGFRPAFKELGELTCILPHVAHLALTATATYSRIAALSEILMYKNLAVVKVNPDRPNIYIGIQTRLPNNRKFEKYDEILKPTIAELEQKLNKFSLTIMYVENLEHTCHIFLGVEREIDNHLEGFWSQKREVYA